jgi:hypothetical protein
MLACPRFFSHTSLLLIGLYEAQSFVKASYGSQSARSPQPGTMNLMERILLLIAASTLLTEAAFAQGKTITSLNTKDTPGTPSTVTVTGATAPSAFAGQTLTLNFLGGTRTLSSYVTSLGTFQPIQVSYDGQLGRDRYNSNGVSGGFRWVF